MFTLLLGAALGLFEALVRLSDARQHLATASLQTPLKEPNGLRMSFFECNAAHTTGYSMATNGVSIATVHVHSQKMDLTFEEVDNFFGWSG